MRPAKLAVTTLTVCVIRTRCSEGVQSGPGLIIVQFTMSISMGDMPLSCVCVASTGKVRHFEAFVIRLGAWDLLIFT